MADEEDPWGFDDGEDAEPASQPAAAIEVIPSKPESVISEHKSEISQQMELGLKQENVVQTDLDVKAPPPPPEVDGYRKPVQLYRHWVRPKFLQCKYMYNYRTNYYDDVIDYLDKKQVGEALRHVQKGFSGHATLTEAVLNRLINPQSGIEN